VSAPAAAPHEPADALERERAVTEFGRSLCVAAGAGSGKTSLLIERLLHALLFHGLELERIVAITFTEKAAAEMRARLREALEEVVRTLDAGTSFSQARAACATEAGRVLDRFAREPWSRGIDPPRVRERAVAALDAQGRLSTIHSFALRLLHRHPIDARLPADVAMDLGDGFRRLAREIVPRLVEQALADERTRVPLAAVLARVELDELSEFAQQLAWLPLDEHAATHDLLAPLRPRLAALEQELRGAREKLRFEPRHVDTLVRQWDDLLQGLALVRERGLEGGRLELPVRVVETLRKDLSKAGPKEPGVDLARCRERLADAKRILAALAAADETFARALLDAVAPLARALRESFLQSGAVTPDGALALAARLLADHPEVRRAEADAIALLCVDEFQDTDPLQCELVLFLCEQATATPAKRAQEVKLAPGRLFLVGDPKQSIYRFRGADLDVYERTMRSLLEQGALRIDLETSFRSPEELVEPLNALFASLMDGKSDAEPPFAPLRAHRQRATRGRRVEVWTTQRNDGRRDADARREAEGRVIAQRIEALHDQGVRYGTIALLLRQLSGLRHYVQPLRERRVPFVLAGGRTFVERSEVGELSSLLLAAADPSDERECLGALRSTLLAVPDAALFAARNECGALDWRRLLKSSEPTVREAARRLAGFHDELATRPVVAAVERFVERGPLLPIAALARDGDQRVANLRKLAEMAGERAQRSGLTLAEAVREIVDHEERVEGDSERSLADEEVDAVRILTIHKAKGLEFDHVIVADLARGERSARPRRVAARLLSDRHGSRVAFRLPDADVLNSAQVACDERDRVHEVAERKRLLYVALTRARERLFLVAGAHDQRAPWIEPLAALGYDASGTLPDDGPLTHDDAHHRRLVMPPRETAPRSFAPADLERLEAATNAFESAVARAREPAPRFARPSSHDEVAERLWSERDEGDRSGDRRDLRTRVGIACHLALARSPSWTVPGEATIAAAAKAAAEPGVSAARIEADAGALLSAAPARALLASLARAVLLARELPLTLERDGVIWRGVADLVFEEAGRIVVGDWKTDREADLDELARRYRPQLSIYRDALVRARKLPRAAEIELLLLRHGRRLRL